MLRHVLTQGAAWERQTSDLLAPASKRPKKKRIGMKAAKQEERRKNTQGALGPEAATAFRAMAARANYLALDRPDISFATKELCRCFAAPTEDAMLALKRLARYLIGAPRLVWHFPFQPACHHLTTSVDTDFAGCLSTRRSTSGGVTQRGLHLLKHWSSTQSTVTLSSAEAELNGICRGACTSLGLQTIAKDMGFSCSLGT